MTGQIREVRSRTFIRSLRVLRIGYFRLEVRGSVSPTFSPGGGCPLPKCTGARVSLAVPSVSVLFSVCPKDGKRSRSELL